MSDTTDTDTSTDEATNDGGAVDPDPLQEDVGPQDVPAGEDGGSLLDFVGGGGIKQMLLREQYEDPETGHTYSQAHLIADVINVMRMDAKQIARIHGIDVEASKMTPERAASLMQAVTTEGGMDIIGIFQQIEDKNDHVLREELNEEQYSRYMRFKQDMLYSVPNDE